MITPMKWSRAFNGRDVLACQAIGGGTHFEFVCRDEDIIEFRLRHAYGRRKRLGEWTNWASLDTVKSNVPWCDAVRVAVKAYRAEESDWTQNREAHAAFQRHFV